MLVRISFSCGDLTSSDMIRLVAKVLVIVHGMLARQNSKNKSGNLIKHSNEPDRNLHYCT